WMRRLITMVPAFIVIGAGMDVTRALVLSQVVLSMVVPFPMAALIWLARRPDLMGQHAAGRGLVLLATAGAALVVRRNEAPAADASGGDGDGMPRVAFVDVAQ
ncbi:divalent metal cation transporter, partial [Mycobacterium tuberculosis]|nr:divalent metal cation transporter [Mycobacterium tuberculosis]